MLRFSPIDRLIGSNQIIRAESILPTLLCIPNAYLSSLPADELAMLLPECHSAHVERLRELDGPSPRFQ
jgi:hypothetical protein